MQRWFLILLVALTCTFSGGCVSAQKRYVATTTQGIYAIQDSLKAGRVDLAQKYAQQLTRVVPAPKKSQRIEVKPIITPATKTEPAQKFIVLPQEYNGTPALTIGTPAFEKVVAENPTIQKQLVKEEKTIQKFETKVDKTQQAIAKEAAKPKKGFFNSIFSFLGVFGLFGGLGVIILLVVIALIFPQAIPLIAARGGTLFMNLMRAIPAFFRKLFNK